METYIKLPSCVKDFKEIPDSQGFCFYCKCDLRRPDKSAKEDVIWFVKGFSHKSCFDNN